MSKKKPIYRYHYNSTGVVELMMEIKENSRFSSVSDLPYVESSIKYNINEKKYDANNQRWVVNQNPAPLATGASRT